MEISDRLATALDALVDAAAAADAMPNDRQRARRAIERATVVARVAREEGFGSPDRPDDAG